jgi:hypothetical protein
MNGAEAKECSTGILSKIREQISLRRRDIVESSRIKGDRLLDCEVGKRC